MAFPRVGLLGRSLLSRGSPAPIACSAIRSGRLTNTVPQRQFIAPTGRPQESAQEGFFEAPSETLVSGAPKVHRFEPARSIVIRHLPKYMTEPELQAILKNMGIEPVDLSLAFDRFSFVTTRTAFIELASEQEAQNAVKKYTRKRAEIKTVASAFRPRRTDADPVGTFANQGSRLFEANESGFAKAIQPILDQRRRMFLAFPPGWGDLKASIRTRNAQNRRVVERVLNPFGVECMSRMVVMWGDQSPGPRLLCGVDFKTREDAEQAVRAIHDTDVEGIRVALVFSEMGPQAACRLGNLDRKSLELLQAKGFAPPLEKIERHKKGFRRLAPHTRSNFPQ